MANMMDYLDWRGDLTFTASRFNEVDNLLFAELVYTSFDGIVTGQSEAEAVTLAEASAVFWGAEQQGGDPCAGVNDKGGAVCSGEDGENRAVPRCKALGLRQ